MTASCVRRRWPAATAPTSTSAPEISVSKPVAAAGGAPLSRDDVAAGRRRGGVGQAAVAAQRPGGVGRGLDLVGRDTVHSDDAGAQVGHLVEVLGPGLATDQRLEVGQLGVLDI